MTYDYGDGITIWDFVENTEVQNVTCDYQLCDLYCCERAMWNRYNSALNTNRVLAAEYFAQLTAFETMKGLIRSAYECAQSADVEAYVNKALAIGNCTPGCGCSDSSEPTPIVGLGASSQLTEIQSSTPSVLTVTSSSDGTTTTWFIGLVNSIVSKITNAYNAVVVGATNIVASASSIVNGIKTYTITGATLSSIDSSVTVTTTVNGDSIITNYDLSSQTRTVLSSDFTASPTPSGTTYQNKKPYTIAANALRTNGDTLVFVQTITGDLDTGNKLKTLLNTSTTVVADYSFVKNKKLNLEFTVSRLSSTTVEILCSVQAYTDGNTVSKKSDYALGVYTVNDLATLTNTFDTWTYSGISGGVSYIYQQIFLFKK